jgi:hypothetical protein
MSGLTFLISASRGRCVFTCASWSHWKRVLYGIEVAPIAAQLSPLSHAFGASPAFID